MIVTKLYGYSMFKKALIILGVMTAVLLVAIPGVARAAEFQGGEQITVTTATSNLYVAGSVVTVQAPVDKDLVAAGSMVTVSESVSDDLIVAASQVNVNANVGGSVRAAGGQVTLSGTFEEDVVVFGGSVSLQKAIVKGDLVVYAGSLQMTNSEIQGDAIGSYSTLQGDVKQIQGENKLKEDKQAAATVKETKEGWRKYFNLPFWMWEISMIVFLAVAVFVLHRRNRLMIPSIGWNKQFALDLALGIVSFGGPLVVFIFGLILQVFPLAMVAILWWVISVFVAAFVTPIYVANLFRGVWSRLGFSLPVGVGVVYLLMVLIGAVKWISLLGLITFVFFCATLGMVLRTKVQMLNWYLMGRKGKK